MPSEIVMTILYHGNAVTKLVFAVESHGKHSEREQRHVVSQASSAHMPRARPIGGMGILNSASHSETAEQERQRCALISV